MQVELLEEERIQDGRLVMLEHEQRLHVRCHGKTRPRVRFAQRSEEIGYSSAGTVSAAWYSLAELLSFKKSFKRMSKMSLETMLPHTLECPAFVTCRGVDRNSGAIPTKCKCKSPLYISPHDEDPNSETTARGLEYACCFERQQRTHRGREVLLRLASKVDASTLARIATQCNAWATQLAVEQALEDAAERIHTRKKTRRVFADFVASKLRR